ncbi:hypothetical protein CJ430_31480, partial [Klebsiella pneumoniae]
KAAPAARWAQTVRRQAPARAAGGADQRSAVFKGWDSTSAKSSTGSPVGTNGTAASASARRWRRGSA